MTQPNGPEGYLARGLSAPRVALPAGAWDCHCHVFGPFARYPVRAGHRYQPPEAPWQDYEAMRAAAGFTNGALVHPSSSGFDNGCTLEAVSHAAGRVVAVAVPDPDASDAELARLHKAGVRAVRFAPAREAADQPGTLDFDHLARWAPRLRDLGWHAQIHTALAGIAGHLGLFAALPIPVVFDHMGGVKGSDDPDGPEFRNLLAYLRDNDAYAKLTLRVASRAPDYADVRRFHDLLVETIPDRVVFGSDWPFINRRSDAPLVGDLIDTFDAWVPDAGLRRQVFVETPLRLFGAE